MSLIWYVNDVQMPSPSSYKINFEDLDNDSYRSVTNGNLIRNIVKRRWAKVAMQWNFISASDVSTIMSSVNADNTTFKMYSPAFGTSGYISFSGYVSKMECELLEGMIGYSLSFNIVQMTGASWQ